MRKTQKIKFLLFEQEWLTGILVPIIAGAIMFFAIKLLGGENYLFWGLATAYWVFGGFIHQKTSFYSLRFEKIHILLAVIMIAISIIGLICKWHIIGWPTMIVGIVIILSALSGIAFKDDYLGGYYKIKRSQLRP